MKRVLSLFLSCIFVLGICFSTPVVASATGEENTITSGEFTYTKIEGDENACVLTGYVAGEDSGTTVVVPQSVQQGEDEAAITYNVVKIASSAFSQNTTITSVTIPASVAEIEVGAFEGCSDLTEIIYKGHNIEWKNIFAGELAEAVTVTAKAEDCDEEKIICVADGNKITVSCDSCKKEFGTITLEAPEKPEGEESLVYDGTAKEAAVKVDGITGLKEIPEVSYGVDEGNNPITPTNAGTYTATLTLVEADAENEIEEVSASATFIIAPKTITTTLTQNSGVYNGDAHTPGVNFNGLCENETLVKDTDYTVEYSDNTNVGTAAVTVTLSNHNYSFGFKEDGTPEYTKGLPYEITKAVPTVETAPTPKEDLFYTGTAHELVTAGTTDDGTMQYKLGSGEWSETIPTAKNAGDYTVYYKVKGDENHDNTEEASVSVAIKKATPTAENFTFTSPENLTYDGNEKTATVEANTGITGMGAITVKYYDSEGKVVTPKEKGTYTVKIDVAEGENFTAATEIINDDWKFTIEVHKHDWKYSASGAVITAECQNAGCEIKSTTITLVVPTDLVYDGTKKEVTVEALHKDLLDKYTVECTGECIDAGEYTAFLSIGEGDEAVTAKKTFTIKKAVITVTAVSAVDRAYNGTLEVEINKNDTIKYTGLITGDEVGFDLSGLTGTIADANVGKDKTVEIAGSIVLTGNDAKNYSVSTPLETTVNITPATVTITPDDLSSEQYYDLPVLTYTVTGLIGDDKVETEPTLTTDADIKKTGDYTITATGATVTNSDNYIIEYATGKMTITEHKNHRVTADGWKESVPGTCMVAGKEEGTCTLCSEVVTRDTETDPDNHRLVTTIVKKATCTQTGEAKVTCANGCDYLLPSELPIDVSAHSFAKEFTVIEATCTTVGSKFKVCENEGCKEVAEKTELAINPDAHKNVETINVKQPTCEEKGYTGDEYCNDCKKTFEPGIEVNALGHTESDWIVDKEATFTEDGARHTACTVCSKELKKEVIAKLTLATPVAKAYNKTSSIKVKWTDVDNALTYNVYRSDFINNSWTKWKKIGVVNQGVGEFSDKNVVEGKQYKYTVKAYNGDYKSSIKTSNKLIFIAPIKPALTITTTGVILKWDTVLGADKYVAYRSQLVDGKWSDWKSVATIKDGKTSTTDTTVESGAVYKYSVRACQGKSYSERKASAAISFLAQPTLKISNTETGIKGSWETINGATGYVITRSEYSDADKKFIATVKLGTAGATAKSFTDKTAKEGVKYKYTVTAINDYGSSVASSGKVLRRLAQPVVTIENANGAIKGNWTQVTGATNYAVYRSEFVDGAWTKWKKLGTAGATAKSFTDKTVKSGVNYKYTVKAINGGSKSSVGASNNVVYLTRPEPTAVNSIYGVKVNWSAITGAESYIVYRKEYVNKQWTEWQQIGTSATNSYIDSTAVSGVKYKYTIHAVNGESLSARKASSSLLYVATPTATVNYTGAALEISWAQIGGATKYVVYRQVLGADGKWSASTKIASLKGVLSFTDTTAEAGNTYRYKVVAYNGKVKSSSNVTDGVLLPNAQ